MTHDITSTPGTLFIPPRQPGTRPPAADVGQVLTGTVTSVTQTPIPAVRMGQTSQVLFFDTFFDDFQLRCQPRYRRYVENEAADDSEMPANSDRRDAPRMIEVSWRPAPELPASQTMPLVPDSQQSGIDTTTFAHVPGITDGDVCGPTAFSNESMNPGTAAVRLTEPNTTLALEPPVDEEAVLTSPQYQGVSVTELISNTDPIRLTQVSFDMLGTLAVTSPAPPDRFRDVRVQVESVPLQSVSVVLVGQAALGVLTTQPTEADSREHVETSLIVSAFSTEIALLDALDDQVDAFTVDPPSQPTSQTTISLSYIGYLIERQRLDDSGVFVDDRRFTVSGVTRDRYLDTGVAYGRVYRYRISSIVRWVHRADLDVERLAVDVRQHAAAMPNGQMVLRYMRSSWSEYLHAVVLDTDLPPPPRDLALYPNSRDSEVIVRWTVPENEQRDISSLILYRRTRRGEVFTSGWTPLAVGLPVSNGLYRDRGVRLREPDEVVYALVSVSIHGQVSGLSEQLSCRLVRHGDELETRMVSFPGIPLSAHGAFSVTPIRLGDGTVTCKTSITVSPRVGPSGYVNIDSDFVLRVQSLETGEAVDLPISVVYKNFIEGAGPSFSTNRGGPSRDFVTPAIEYSPPVPGGVPPSTFSV